MAKLEYDEDEGTFTYFLVLLYGLFLLIASYFLWPGLGKDDSKDKKLCQCGPCCRKRTKMESEQPFKKEIVILVVLWAVLFYLVYWALTQERNYIKWDPFEVLQLDREASKAEIRKQYKELSKKYHPDKETGDQEMFMKIAKAYEVYSELIIGTFVTDGLQMVMDDPKLLVIRLGLRNESRVRWAEVAQYYREKEKSKVAAKKSCIMCYSHDAQRISLYSGNGSS